MTRFGLVGLAALLALSACGNSSPMDQGLNDLPRTGAARCLTDDQIGSAPILTTADLDGDGSPDNVQFTRGRGNCRDVLFARAGGKRRGTVVTGDLPMAGAQARALDLPGRSGQLLLVIQHHPRGGFQARLFGYADGRLEELVVDAKPVFPFVATDVAPTPLSAACTRDGFEITGARAHQPVGIVPAWDVFRTPYAVDGNNVTAGATAKIADNVLEKGLRTTYRDLVHHVLFTNCRANG